LKSAPIRSLVDEYLRRLTPYYSIDEVELRAASGRTPERAIADDTTNVLAAIRDDESLWLLDREGTAWSSQQLAAQLIDEGFTGTSRLTLAIGGAYGFDARLQRRANRRWSLSPLTFLHEWARAIVTEQLYRAAKIHHGEPYHH